jgi:type II secretory pathway pseudopilin PulG
MLMVVGIIAVVAALLLPALAAGRRRGRTAACLSNLRQIGTSLHAYDQDWEALPPGNPFPPRYDPLKTYGVTRALYHCPEGDSALATTYQFRFALTLFPPGVDRFRPEGFTREERERYTWRVRPDPNTVLAYCPHEVRPRWGEARVSGTFLALRANGAAQNVPAERVARRGWKDGRWLPPEDARTPADRYDVFPDEHWPPEFEEKGPRD